MGFDGGNLSVTISRRIAISVNGRPGGRRRGIRRRRPVLGRRREARDGVLGRSPRWFADAPSRPSFRRKVYPDVDEHHDAAGDVEGPEG